MLKKHSAGDSELFAVIFTRTAAIGLTASAFSVYLVMKWKTHTTMAVFIGLFGGFLVGMMIGPMPAREQVPRMLAQALVGAALVAGVFYIVAQWL